MKNFSNLTLKQILLPGILATAVFLSGCGGSTPEVVQTPLPPPVDNATVTYSGPPSPTPDVQQFKLALWDNIVSTERCGACHVENNQSPPFVRSDDINLAYTHVYYQGQFYQQAAEDRIKGMIAMIEPAMTLIVGGMVAFVYIGFFKAMIQVSAG